MSIVAGIGIPSVIVAADRRYPVEFVRNNMAIDDCLNNLDDRDCCG